jgi:hypothetical protein
VSRLESAEGFRFAVVGAGATDLAPTIATDDRRRSRMVRYLNDGTILVRDPTTSGTDPLDPAGRVPRGYRTDGEWIWPEALAYFLDRHNVAPEPEFAELMVERGFWSTRASAGRVGQARLALAARGLGPFEPPAPSQDRFPSDVYDVLVTYGWTPGRTTPVNVAAGLPPMPDELVAAGVAILAEFGGLTVPVYGYGPDWPIVGFQMLPDGDAPDSDRLIAADLRLGGPFFPLGSVYDWRSEIVLHLEHGIVVVGDVDRHLGADIDAALTALCHGRVGAQAGAQP